LNGCSRSTPQKVGKFQSEPGSVKQLLLSHLVMLGTNAEQLPEDAMQDYKGPLIVGEYLQAFELT